MGTVRITADIAAGSAEIQRAFYDENFMMSDGKKQLAAAIAEAANAILRSYGIKEQLAVVSEAAAALQRLRKAEMETAGELYQKGTQVGD